MRILTDYFAAPTDALAATVVREDEGPSTTARGSGQPLFDTVRLPSIEPFVMIGTLAEVVCGLPYPEVTAHPRHGSLVVAAGDEGPWVVTVSDHLTAALAAASPSRLADVARRWSGAPELAWAPAGAVATAVLALGALAARAADARHALYCWTRLPDAAPIGPPVGAPVRPRARS
ncbi:hypothetical protein GCM10009809_24720 [Isoptericola hypogeus]|uniref:Siderophore-interacting protein n=1 Tax=Isoptericola hypogeus TaxID=300179 RepID=A0ABN2JI65_9MICO